MGKTVSKTDIGLKRELNQDYVFTAELPVGKLPNLYLVADGMGGHKAGGYASKYAVETIVEVVNSSKEEDAFTILYQAIVEANYRIRKKASEDESMTGMGPGDAAGHQDRTDRGLPAGDHLLHRRPGLGEKR